MIDTYGRCTSLSIPFFSCGYVLRVNDCSVFCFLPAFYLRSSACMHVYDASRLDPWTLNIFCLCIWLSRYHHRISIVFAWPLLLGGLDTQTCFFSLLLLLFAFVCLCPFLPSCLPVCLPSIRAGLLGLSLYLASLLHSVRTFGYLEIHIHIHVHCAFGYFVRLAWYAVQAQQQCCVTAILSIHSVIKYLPTYLPGSILSWSILDLYSFV